MWVSGHQRWAEAFRALVSSDAAQGGKDHYPTRFTLLDASRALAALAVLFWHYQHFFIPLNGRSPVDPFAREPLAGVFGLFYRHGDLAVPIFWMISGLVFAHVYTGAQANTRDLRSIGSRGSTRCIS